MAANYFQSSEVFHISHTFSNNNKITVIKNNINSWPQPKNSKNITYATSNWTTMIDFFHHGLNLSITLSSDIPILINPETVITVRGCTFGRPRVTGFTNFQRRTIETVIMTSCPTD